MCVKTKIRLLFVSLLSTELHERHGFHGHQADPYTALLCHQADKWKVPAMRKPLRRQPMHHVEHRVLRDH